MNEQTSSDRGSAERSILEELARDNLKERRRARRWGIFFKLFFAAYLVVVTVMISKESLPQPSGAHTALVELEGTIARHSDVDADVVAQGLRRAFEAKDSQAVILRINSPGGSPVQAGLINVEMHRLREKYPDKPLYVVIGDMCASGGYYAAVAAERIYADQASIVGSIGVLMNSFGLVEAMEKLGVERRLYTAGEHKAFLDPFSPVKPSERRHVDELLDQVHQQFIDTVRADRGERLSPDPEIFSGLFWTGQEALRLGLVDEFGSAGSVARDIVGAEKLVDYTPKEDLLGRVTRQLGVAIANTLKSDLLWDRIRFQ
ncbi:MAG: S49 family peptidase [Gammaproteobacteria bacterium]|nr:S49 family peptidase [Gammaproteobacteria bacterium]